MNSMHLHQKTVNHPTGLGMGISRATLTNLARLSQGLVISESCQLAKLVLGVPLHRDRE